MITRSNFRSLSAATAMLAASRTIRPVSALASTVNSAASDGRPAYAVLHSLAPEAIKPEGWLALYLFTLVLPMTAALSHRPNNGVGVEPGPPVYSLPTKEEWTPLVLPKYSIKDFPCWNAVPGSAWNYGLAVDGAKLNSETQIQRKQMAEDPWTGPAISAIIPLRKFSGWELESDPKNANQQFTPALADVAKVSVVDASEPITLVPYGSTHLCLTVFPDVSASSRSASPKPD